MYILFIISYLFVIDFVLYINDVDIEMYLFFSLFYIFIICLLLKNKINFINIFI